MDVVGHRVNTYQAATRLVEKIAYHFVQLFFVFRVKCGVAAMRSEYYMD